MTQGMTAYEYPGGANRGSCFHSRDARGDAGPRGTLRGGRGGCLRLRGAKDVPPGEAAPGHPRLVAAGTEWTRDLAGASTGFAGDPLARIFGSGLPRDGGGCAPGATSRFRPQERTLAGASRSAPDGFGGRDVPHAVRDADAGSGSRERGRAFLTDAAGAND